MTLTKDLELQYVTGDDGARHLTLPDETRAWVISFVREHAEKPADQIAAIVQEGQDDLHAQLEGVTDEQARYKPRAEDWCILELMDHVVSIKRIIASMGRSLAAGQPPPGLTEEWKEEARQDGLTVVRFSSLAEAVDACDAAHGEFLSFVRSLMSDVHTDLEFPHFLFGPMNCRQWAVFQRIHDLDHAPSIARIKAASNYPD